MKRLLVIGTLLAAHLASTVHGPLAAAAQPRVFRDGLECNVQTVNHSGRTYMRLRQFGECLGLVVEWDPDSEQARIFGQIGTHYADLRLYPTRNYPWVWAYNSDGTPIATHDMGSSRPLLIDGSTYLPMRFLAEAWLRVDYISEVDNPRGYYPEIRMNSDLRPEPWDAGNMGAYVQLQNNRFSLSEMPADGWPVSPAGYIAVVETINAANAAMDDIDRSGRGRMYEIDRTIPRVTFIKGGHVIDWYSTHQVVWMKSEDVAQEYIAGLTDDGWWGIVTGATANAGIAGIGLIFEVPWFISTPVGLMVSLAQWRFDQVWRQQHQDCLDAAREDPAWRSEAPAGEGILGFVYGPSGVVNCISHWTRSPIGYDGLPN